MKSRICKQTIHRLMFEGLVVIMLFGLVGCGSTKNKSAEDIAEIYLKKTYNKEFVVEELTKKDAGPFKTKEYSGFAYEKNHPENRFTVWVDKDKGKVSDAYYSVAIHSTAEEWLEQQAKTIWKDAKVALIIDVVRPSSQITYKSDDFLTFFENESVEVSVYLFVNETDILQPDDYARFDEAISNVVYGYVRIYKLEESQMKTLEKTKYYSADPDISISTDATDKMIEEKIH